MKRQREREKFSRRVYELMRAKGWYQSELARRAGLSRDSISTYVTGRCLPTSEKLIKLARALNVAPQELLPTYGKEKVSVENGERLPALEMKISPTSPDLAWLRVNRLVSAGTAIKVVEMLNNDRTSNAGGGTGAPAVQSLKN